MQSEKNIREDLLGKCKNKINFLKKKHLMTSKVIGVKIWLPESYISKIINESKHLSISNKKLKEVNWKLVQLVVLFEYE